MRKIRLFLPRNCRWTVCKDWKIRQIGLESIETYKQPSRGGHAVTAARYSSSSSTAIDILPSAPSLRNRLLVATLEQVPVYGWTEDAIATAAAGLDPPQSLAIAGLLTVRELVSKAMDHWNAALRNELEQRRGNPPTDITLSDTDQIVYAFQWRLERIQDLIRCHQWHEGMAVGAQPGQILQTKDQIAEIVEITVNHCSSTFSTAERLGLGAVYIATEFHMLSDVSENFQDTWAFLRKLVDDWDRLRQHLPFSELPCFSSNALWTTANVGSAVFSGVLTVLSRPTVRFGSHPKHYDPPK